MHELLLRVGGRPVRILLEDTRGEDGAIPTLICSRATVAEILPHAPTQEEYPTFPSELRAVPPRTLTVDTSGLTSGVVPFALEPFAERAAAELDSGVAHVAIDDENAAAWGQQRPYSTVGA